LNTCMLASELSALSTASASLCSSHVFCPLYMSFAHLSVPLQMRDLQGRPCVCSVLRLHRYVGLTVSRVFFFSLTHLDPPSPSAPHPRAHPNSDAQIDALRAQPDAQPTQNTPDTKVRHRAPHSCRAPFLSHHAQAYCNLGNHRYYWCLASRHLAPAWTHITPTHTVCVYACGAGRRVFS
jgi:hypothetical protein